MMQICGFLVFSMIPKPDSLMIKTAEDAVQLIHLKSDTNMNSSLKTKELMKLSTMVFNLKSTQLSVSYSIYLHP